MIFKYLQITQTDSFLQKSVATKQWRRTKKGMIRVYINRVLIGYWLLAFGYWLD